jgi:hypothetical protein
MAEEVAEEAIMAKELVLAVLEVVEPVDAEIHHWQLRARPIPVVVAVVLVRQFPIQERPEVPEL